MPDGVEQAAASGNERLRIGDWIVEPALNQLSSAGRKQKLEPKAMALLRYLSERPGQVVSREALLAAVWPGVVVGDDSLTQAVIKLRKALGDVAEAPAYIQTIPKGGYRLVAPVGPAEHAASASVAPVAESPASIRTGRRVWLVPAGVAVLLFAAGGIWWINDRGIDGFSPGSTAVTGAEAARAAQPTISIRPFEALGEDPRAELLARGITADLVTDLSKVFGLSVIAAVRPAAPGNPETAVRAPAGNAETAVGASAGNTGTAVGASPENTETAAGAPAVRYVVSGSVQRVDDRVRLHIHLTDAQTGKQLWSERFDRPLSDLFAIQDELGRRILQILPAKVSEAELRRIARPHTRNLEAYEYFQRGQQALLVRQQAENETAREMFQRAIALDATFARAYAALALTYAADYRNQWTRDGAAALERAWELARTAHEINPEIRETYWVLGFVHLERRQHKQAMQHLETAVRLSPSFSDAYALMGGINAYVGQPANALPLLRTAMRLNPEAGYLYFLILGRAYFALGDLEQARVNLEHALMRNPVNLEARVYLAAVHVAAGNKAGAAWEAEEIRTLQPGFSTRAWLATHPLTDAEVQAKLVATLKEAGF